MLATENAAREIMLGDVMVEYIIGVFLLIFMVSHMTKVHLLKNDA